MSKKLNDPRETSRRILLRLAELGLSHRDLAERSKLPMGLITKIRINHIRRPSQETLTRIAAVLQCDAEWLVAGDFVENTSNPPLPPLPPLPPALACPRTAAEWNDRRKVLADFLAGSRVPERLMAQITMAPSPRPPPPPPLVSPDLIRDIAEEVELDFESDERAVEMVTKIVNAYQRRTC